MEPKTLEILLDETTRSMFAEIIKNVPSSTSSLAMQLHLPYEEALNKLEHLEEAELIKKESSSYDPTDAFYYPSARGRKVAKLMIKLFG